VAVTPQGGRTTLYLEETLPHIGGRIMGGFAGFVVGGLLGSAAWLAIGAPQEAYGLALLVGLSFSVGGGFFVSRSVRANTEMQRRRQLEALADRLESVLLGSGRAQLEA
jgi:hypothetical protein